MKNKKYPKFTEEEISTIIYLYEVEKISSLKIAQKIGRSQFSVLENLRKNNVQIRLLSNTSRKHAVNHNFFEKIDSEAKAYFLGLLYADGCIVVNKGCKNSGKMVISLQEEDGYILEDFKSCMEYSGPLLKCPKSNGWKTQTKLSVTSGKIFEDLIKLGCTPNKTFILKFPTFNQVPDYLIHHFIRGYFDGDGCVRFYIPNTSKNKSVKIGFCGTKEMMASINHILCEKFKVDKIAKITSHRNIFYFEFNKYCNVKLFYNFLYKDATIFLTRKEEKAREVFNLTLKGRHLS